MIRIPLIIISIYTGEIPYLTTGQMIEVDRTMMEDYKIRLWPYL